MSHLNLGLKQIRDSAKTNQSLRGPLSKNYYQWRSIASGSNLLWVWEAENVYFVTAYMVTVNTTRRRTQQAVKKLIDKIIVALYSKSLLKLKLPKQNYFKCQSRSSPVILLLYKIS